MRFALSAAHCGGCPYSRRLKPCFVLKFPMTKTDDEIRILAPNGVCGSGFLEESFERGLANKPHFIGCDGGSTDPGPSHLGSGEPAFPREAVKRDLRLMLLGARRLNVPLMVGSVGTAGGDTHLQWCYDILKEI